METLTVNRLRMQDFPNRSFYCIQQKSLPSGYPLHQHDFFEIEFVLSGKGKHYLNGRVYPLQRGCVYFLDLSDFHEITVEEPIEVLTLMFSDHWVNDTLLYQLLRREDDLQCSMEEDALCRLLLLAEQIRDEYDSVKPLRDVAMRNLTEYLLIQLLRHFDVRCANLTENIDHPVSRVLLYLTAHFRENPSLSLVAEMVNHNSNYFSELFHKTTGQSYVQYLNSLKLNHARKLLSSTDQSITEIGAASGFNSYSSFSHAFRQIYGCSANEFRRKQRQSKKISKKESSGGNPI